ncbi:HlyD family secretion protein [Budvicia diplopodorum]|uniref:HlyD family secretion protein n=1 Tax=Budvicia diplopodorum TaxID=1119056 RepID=UPI00135AA073|nr:HlyD family secretion protein [Budvicia diplopodorum]
MTNAPVRLFRQEVIDHNKNVWLGKITLISRIPAWVIALFSLFVLVAFLLFLIFGSFIRRVNVAGEAIIYPHPVEVFAAYPGIVEKSFIEVGSRVNKGQKLYQIDMSRVTSSGNASQKDVETISQQLAKNQDVINKLTASKQETITNLKHQLDYYQKAYQQSRSVLADSLLATSDMEKTLSEYSRYIKSGLITKDQLNNQRYMYQQQQSVYNNLYAQNTGNALQLINIQSEIAVKSAEFDNQISQSESQRESLKREYSDAEVKGGLVITSPMEGKIESMVVTEGQMVNTGDTMVQIAREQSRAAYLVFWLPNDALPFVRPGEPVNVRYDAFPFEKFGQFPAEVVSVSSIPASVHELNSYKNSPLNSDRTHIASYYKTIVKLDRETLSYADGELNVSSGMKAQATFFLESRPLYQWMLSPLYKINHSMTGPLSE